MAASQLPSALASLDPTSPPPLQARNIPLSKISALQKNKTMGSPSDEDPPAAESEPNDDDENDNDDDGGENDNDPNDEDEEDEEEVDEEQLEEYQEMLESLGPHPDKVKINSLSMVAESFAASPAHASALYATIRRPLLSPSTPADHKLPLVYVVDSLLKNVRGQFLPIIERDAKRWMAVVYRQLEKGLSDPAQAAQAVVKLRKVWTTWKDCNLFSEASWEAMGACFIEADGIAEAKRTEVEAAVRAAGLARNRDGTLQIGPELRRQMQLLLDEAQSEGVDELDKVSLERLAEINPNLLAEIKAAAEEIVASGGGGVGGGVGGGGVGGGGGSGATGDYGSNGLGGPQQQHHPPSAFVETRSEDILNRAAEWNALDLDHLEKAHDSISKLQHHVRAGCTSTQPRPYEDETAFRSHMGLLIAASSSARYLTQMLQVLKAQEDAKDDADGGTGTTAADLGKANKFVSASVDPKEFTTQGLRKKNPAVIARLYDGGLPFVCASDGRRFATQLDLTRHMDVLFKRGQIEKSMEKTEERGWYISQDEWSGKNKKAADAAAAASGEAAEGEADDAQAAAEDTADPNTFTVPADESRDRCLICGINFAMFFDQDEGEFMYKNCREVTVLNDEMAINESDEIFVHVTCLRGLGNPKTLTMDQVLQVDQ